MRADLPLVTDLGGGAIFEQGLYSSGGYTRAFTVFFSNLNCACFYLVFELQRCFDQQK